MRIHALAISVIALALTSGCAFINDFGSYRRTEDGSVPPMDGGPIQRRDAGPDATIPSGCEADADCDDGVSCTTDVCGGGTCTHTPNDAVCTAGGGGQCDPVQDCQYDECNEATCVAGPCQTARCDGNVCLRENTCASDQTCCGNACVARGCDDGIACTADSCGPEGCENVPNDALCEDGDPCTVGVCMPGVGCMQTAAANGTSCDDGVFCNGADTCQGGSCAGHAGNPCPGASRCEEAVRSCTGCVTNADCPAPVEGSWSACSYASTCATSGTQSRSVTTFQCVSGMCQSSSMTQTQACTRTTEGSSCGSRTCGSYGACGWSSTCATSATQTRTCTTPVCRSGTCASEMSTESQACTRTTEGVSCGTETCSAWSACSGFASTCATTGTQTRTCMVPVCRGGGCATESRTDTQSCTRSTDGASCGSETCVTGPCGHDDMCGGQQTITCTPRVCRSGGCTDGSPRVSTDFCFLNTEGLSCDRGGGLRGRCCGGVCGTSRPGEFCAIK